MENLCLAVLFCLGTCLVTANACLKLDFSSIIRPSPLLPAARILIYLLSLT